MPTQASEYHTTSIYPNLDIKSICHVPEGYKEHKRISEDGLDIWTFLFDFPNPNSHFNSTKPVVTDPRALTTSSVDGETVNRATSWTFDEVKVRSEKLGRILQRKYGLGPRDVVGILAGNGIGFGLLFLSQ